MSYSPLAFAHKQSTPTAAFASQKLQKSGRCHESEVYKQFRRAYARYRSEEVISDDVLRDMVRNFHPAVDRSSTGYLKNLSLKPGGCSLCLPILLAGCMTMLALQIGDNKS